MKRGSNASDSLCPPEYSYSINFMVHGTSQNVWQTVVRKTTLWSRNAHKMLLNLVSSQLCLNRKKFSRIEINRAAKLGEVFVHSLICFPFRMSISTVWISLWCEICLGKSFKYFEITAKVSVVFNFCPRRQTYNVCRTMWHVAQLDDVTHGLALPRSAYSMK